MIIFLKANLSSIVSSLFDYLVHIVLVKYFNIDVVVASAAGTITGGTINFLIGRQWVFNGKDDSIQSQATRYLFVWIGNFVLNTTGVFILAKIFDVHYVTSKILVSLTVAFAYNYPFQKYFVFKKR